jgi:membrane-bound lytic murein transglycosylase A
MATRSRHLGGVLLAVCAALLLQACASTSDTSGKLAQYPTPERPIEPPPPARDYLHFADLPGWNQEDHAAGLDAFRNTCGVSKDPAVRDICSQARALGSQDEMVSRAFIEANFRPVPVGEVGLLTAYFAPRYEARDTRDSVFSEPVRGRPSDLVVLDLTKIPGAMASNADNPVSVDFTQAAVPPMDIFSAPHGVALDVSQWNPAPKGTRITGRVRGGMFQPYGDRAAVVRSTPETILAWMKPEDLFFLQIQGSGVLTFPDGRQLKAAYAIGNGKPFVGIATTMRNQGLLADNNTSGDRIHAWLADHRGPKADAVMALNPSYVYFTLGPYDGAEPAGAAGVSLPAGRAIAVDSTQHRYGNLYWLDASVPSLAGAYPAYRRLAMALDTGGAIKGQVRADLYMGTGDRAGAEAGRVKHQLKMYRLVPIGGPTTVATGPMPFGKMAPIP